MIRSANQEHPVGVPASDGSQLSHVRTVVQQHFPSLWPAVEGGLATCATLLLSDNANPVALIYMGPPSAGKTTVVSMFEGAKANGQPLCYRSDKFTPAAFVSQSAKATSETLKTIDLLPRIKDKVLLTPELSTIFRGKQDELAERFSTITRVLDGQGFTTDSGTHGRRGYEGDYLFAWLGATTPFEPNVWKVMAQLGSRMFFLVMDAVAEPTIEQLVEANCQVSPYKEEVKVCQQAVHLFLDRLFQQLGGVREVRWNAPGNAGPEMKVIAHCAKLLAVLRTPYEAATMAQSESPHRASAVLYNLARGHALICGRTAITSDDLPLMAQITLSSIPAKRRAVLLALIKNEGEPLTIEQTEKAGVGSRHTCEEALIECEWLGLGTYERPGVGKPSRFTLHADWAWCTGKEIRPLLLTSDLARIRG